MEAKDIFSKETVSPFSRVTDYLYMIRQNWLLGAVLGITLASICTLYLYSRIPSYRSYVQLFVELTPERILDVDQVVDTAAALNTGNASAILNHYLIEFRSRKLLDYVVSGLDESMIERIIEPYRDSELAEPNVSNIIRKAINVSLHLDNKVFTISVTHRDAAVTADLANFFATKYLEYNLKDLGSSNTSAQLFLNKNAKEIQDSILKDQLELQGLQKKHNIISIEESRSITINKITNLNAHLIRLNIEKQGFETILEQLKVREIDIDTDIENESQITAALEIPEINQFAQVETIKAELDQTLIAQKQIELVYLEKHPNYIQNKKRITELRSQLRTDISLAIKSFVTQSEKIVAQMDKIKTDIGELEDEAKRLDSLSITLLSLEMKINNNKSTLAGIESRINETTISSQLSKASMRILDNAVKPFTPHYPNNKHTIAIGVSLFIVGFIGLPVGIGLINNKLRTSWDVEEFIEKPLLGEIEHLKKEHKPNIHQLVTQSEIENNSIIDTFRAIYKNIRLSTSNVDRKIQIITSAMPNEGKTTFALNYAATCAQHEKRVLLIDFDLRKPQIQNYTKTGADTGLVDWFNHGAELPTNDQLHEMLGIHLLDSGVYLLPAGKATNRATELAENRKFRQLVLNLSDQFDYVILDTPPLTTFPDAMFIADCAQDIIFICKYNYVNKILIKQLIERLEKTAASVCGIIINQSKTKGKGKDHYGYSYGSKY